MFAVFVGAPFLPTHARAVATMMTLADVKEGDTFVDLGSGDGRLLIAAARRGAHTIGYEMNPFLVALSYCRALHAGVSGRVRVRWQSLWNADLRDVDVVSIFGITGIMPRLEKKFERELHVGTRVVSYVFALPRWKAIAHEDGIRLYRKE